MNPERARKHSTRPIEFRSAPFANGFQRRADDEAPGFTGYASTFWVVDSYYTAVAPGAFTKTLKERGDRIPHLWQHDPTAPIGKHRELRVDDKGLWVDVELIDDGAEGTVAIKRLKAGVPLGLSFGFSTIKERPARDSDPLIFPNGLDELPTWVRDDLPESIYVLEELKYYEDSTVTFPANETATIDSVRNADQLAVLGSLLDDLHEGRLSTAQRALVAELVAAWTAEPESPSGSPLTDAKARPDAAAVFDYLRIQAEALVSA